MVIDLGETPRSLDISDPEVINVTRVGLTNRIRIEARSAGDSYLNITGLDGRARQFLFFVWQVRMSWRNLCVHQVPPCLPPLF